MILRTPRLGVHDVELVRISSGFYRSARPHKPFPSVYKSSDSFIITSPFQTLRLILPPIESSFSTKLSLLTRPLNFTLNHSIRHEPLDVSRVFANFVPDLGHSTQTTGWHGHNRPGISRKLSRSYKSSPPPGGNSFFIHSLTSYTW
jgi:hypothetical protein